MTRPVKTPRPGAPARKGHELDHAARFATTLARLFYDGVGTEALARLSGLQPDTVTEILRRAPLPGAQKLKHLPRRSRE